MFFSSQPAFGALNLQFWVINIVWFRWFINQTMPSGRRNSGSDSETVSLLWLQSKLLRLRFKWNCRFLKYKYKISKFVIQRRGSTAARRGSDQRIIVSTQQSTGVRLTRVEASTDESETSGHHNKDRANVSLIRRVDNNYRRNSSSGNLKHTFSRSWTKTSLFA